MDDVDDEKERVAVILWKGEDVPVCEVAEESVAGGCGVTGEASAALKTFEARPRANDEQRRPTLWLESVCTDRGRDSS